MAIPALARMLLKRELSVYAVIMCFFLSSISCKKANELFNITDVWLTCTDNAYHLSDTFKKQFLIKKTREEGSEGSQYIDNFNHVSASIEENPLMLKVVTSIYSGSGKERYVQLTIKINRETLKYSKSIRVISTDSNNRTAEDGGLTVSNAGQCRITENPDTFNQL